ncbi:MAG: NAD-dependent malic enzyme [Firmicutes bacterium]|nr:NAD-dependent malic enzyme [Bacillota bacterium]
MSRKTLKEEALELHRACCGKVALAPKVPVDTPHDLSLAYTPGVAEPCRRIHQDPDLVYEYTSKGNLVAVISDGSAVLGLGNIGPLAGLPVMEGKSILFKRFGGVDSFPIMLATQEVPEMVAAIEAIAPGLGGINLEDISAPRCFQVEEELIRRLDIPVFHDDQHGTAVVVYAALINALKVVGKELARCRIVINGAGAAGIATTRLLLAAGAADIILCDRNGAIYSGRPAGMNPYKEDIAAHTNPEGVKGDLAVALRGADVFIGVSGPDVLTPEMVRSMAAQPIVFAMANPDPEIRPELAQEAGVAVMATGRSDYPNQVNNVLGFPGIFRGALDVRARVINEQMKMAAALAIAGLISPEELSPGYIIPQPFDPRVPLEVALAVARAAVDSGVARREVQVDRIRRHLGLAPLE